MPINFMNENHSGHNPLLDLQPFLKNSDAHSGKAFGLVCRVTMLDSKTHLSQ